MASILTVDGVAYDQAARKSSSLIVDAWGWDTDADYWLEFHEYCAGYQPAFSGPKEVSFTDASSTLRFTGDITGVQPGWGDGGRTWCYRCQGLKYRGNMLPVTGVDGAGLMAWNLRLDDEDYLASNAGKSLGDILAAAFTQHSSALGAIGISTDGTTASQMAAYTIVPQEPVYLQGERLIDAIEWILRQYAGYARMLITPAGKVRFIDMTAGASHTLTLGTDPVDPPLFSRDWSTCATRVVVRGRGEIYPAVVSLLNLDLVPAWTPTQQAAWKMDDFDKPGDAYDYGTVTTTGGPTTITVHSHDGATAWPANFWSDREAWVYLQKATGTGLTYSESRPVTACTALTAGGTSVLTLGLDLDNSASTAWDTYTLVGKSGDLAAGRNNVYRLFDVVTPGNWIEQHLVKNFPQPVPFVGLNNAMVQLVSSPVCMVVYQGGSSVPATFRVIPSTGQILFDRPYIEAINQAADLALGGAHVLQADDLVVLLAYSRGALSAPYPADVAGVPQYAGTAFSIAGLERTGWADVDSWRYKGNEALMVDMAKMLHQSRCDTVISGTVQYKGVYSTVLDPGTGHKLSFASVCGTTGDEALGVPVRAVTVKYATGGGGLLATTEMAVSSRRDPRTSQGMYMHLSQFGSGIANGAQGNADEANRAAFGQSFGEGNADVGNKMAGAQIARNQSQTQQGGQGSQQGGSGPLNLGMGDPGAMSARDMRPARDGASARDATSARDSTPARDPFNPNTYKRKRRRPGGSQGSD